MEVDFDAPRFTTPILTVRDVAQLVGMPIDTAQAWAGQRKDRAQLFTRITPLHRGWPSVPLVGLAEASSLRALRQILPLREIPVAVDFIRTHAHEQHALANQRLVTDGVTVFLEEHEDVVRLRDRQVTIAEVFREHLKPMEYDGDDYPEAYNVPRLPGVQIHPLFNAGRMSFRRNRVPLFAVAGLLSSGEQPAVVALEFGLAAAEVSLVVDHLAWLGQAA
jgi:uncharacterized protein (DUF433 family)